MRLIDLDQTVFVPLVDESKGGVKYEVEMTIAEMFDKFFDSFQPKVVDAITVEWLESKRKEALHEGMRPDEVEAVEMVLWMWQKEQEAR